MTSDHDPLAEALHDRYAGALCISDLDLHDYDGCDAQAQWVHQADDVRAALDAAGYEVRESHLSAAAAILQALEGDEG